VSPQFLDGELIGTVDSYGITGVPGPPTPEKCNDYIAAIAASQPGTFIGYASVNPNYRGPDAAVRELERAVRDLGLAGLKLYPMYQDWSPADPVLAFPVFAKAQELGIPVMVHQAGSTRIDARMEHARPALLDAAGRHFRDLRLTIAHCGLPWVDEAMFMLTKHPNFYAELSYHIASVTTEELFRFLVHAEASFVPLEKIFFGTDYPGFLYDPVKLRAKLLAVNDHAGRVGAAPIPQAKLDGILGTNYARMTGLIPD
jgi:predicted TIM-barrel fold metal-dependent hydrolase